MKIKLKPIFYTFSDVVIENVKQIKEALENVKESTIDEAIDYAKRILNEKQLQKNYEPYGFGTH